MCLFRRNQELKKIERLYADRRFSFYSEEEKNADPSKKNTDGYAFIIDEKAPLYIVIPGGAYHGVAMGHEGVHFAEELNRRGYNAFVLRYRVFPHAKAPNPQTDAAALVKYIFAHQREFGFETEEYGVVGFSAGGHLAASFGLKNVGYASFGVKKPTVAILAYPVVSMGEETHAGTKEALLVCDSKKAEPYSVEKNVDKDYPATFVWCCADDSCVPPANTELLAEALQKVGVPCEKEVYPTGGHGKGIATGTSAEGWLDKALAFTKKYM